MLFSLAVVSLAGLAAAQQTPDLLGLLSSPGAANLSTITQLVQQSPGLVDALSQARNITILAPSNAAFQALNSSGALQAVANQPGLLPNLLTYHVLNGSYPASAFASAPAFVPSLLNNDTVSNVTGGQRVSGRTSGQDVIITSGLKKESKVVQANLNFTGGVVHVIDAVLTLPANISATATSAGLSALVGALTKANLVGTLDGLRDVTVFAPSNAAFEAIGSAVGGLTTEQLVGILGGHVINGTVGYSSSLSNTSLTTLGGSTVNVTVGAGGVFVNQARVINSDILVANGVVHVIDSVLNPNSTDQVPPTGTSAIVAFPGASTAAGGNPLTSGVPQASTTIPQLTQTTANVAPSSTSSATPTGGAAGVVPAVWTGALAVAMAAVAL